MSTIIIITPPPKPKLTVGESLDDDKSKVRLVVDDTGTMADRLRAAADLLDGLS